MNMFSTRKSDPTPVAPTPCNGAHSSAASGGLLSRGVSIKGTVKFSDELLIDGKFEGTIDSTGTLTVGEHASIKGEIKTKSIKVRGTVRGDIVATARCELQAGCTLQGDIEAPRLIVDENATFCGSATVAPQG